MILRLCVLILGIFLSSLIFPGIEIRGWGPVKAALLLGLLNISIKPLLLLLTLPINILTLGLFTLVINGFLFWMAGRLIEGFEVSGFLVAMAGAVIISVLSIFLNRVIDA